MSDAEIQSIYETARRTNPGSDTRQEALKRLKPLIDTHPNALWIFAMVDALIHYPAIDYRRSEL
jgi:hypothetical protein